MVAGGGCGTAPAAYGDVLLHVQPRCVGCARLRILAACVIDPRRLHLLAGLLALAPWPLLAVVLADRSHALTTATAALSDATREGHRLALWIVVLAAGSAVVAFALGLVEARVRIQRVVRMAFAGLLVLGLAGAAAAVWVHWGSPSSLATRAYDSFRAPPKSVHGNLAGRLLSLSQRPDRRVARRLA